MSKVKLTQEQAEIIEETKFALAGFSNDILVRCLNGEYEVEPEFKVGDWVVRTKELDHQNFHEGKIFKINSVIKSELMKELMVVDADDNSEHLFNNIRHATPEEIAEEKERRWWSARNREIWELRTRDILINENEDTFEVTNSNPPEGYYSIEYTLFDIDEVKGSFRVLCFAENREDVKDDE